MAVLIWIIKIVVLVYLGLGLLLYLAQRHYLYFPTPAHDSSAFPSEWIESDGQSIKLWVIGQDQPAALIYFGGNAEDTFYTAQHFAAQLPGRAIYLVNYRGYGGSSGAPTERGLFADGLSIFDHVAERHAAVAIAGRSLGSGIATYVAAQRSPAQVVLITPADSVAAVAQRMYPMYPVDWLLKDRYESIRYAPSIQSPTLVIAAERDAIIPAAHTQRLLENFPPDTARHVMLPGADHNDLSVHPDYMTTINTFLSKP